MKKIIITALSIIVTSNLLHSQLMENDAIMSGGQSSMSGGIYMISAVGELAVREVTQGGYHISEGFINPGISNSMAVSPEQMLEGVNVYPNPAAENLFIETEAFSEYEISIFDMTGKVVFQNAFEGNQYQIDLSGLSRTNYLLLINDKKNNKLKWFKLTKK